jgi:hypothetical protein
MQVDDTMRLVLFALAAELGPGTHAVRAMFLGVRDNSRDNKRTVRCVQIFRARRLKGPQGPYGRFDPTPDKVEGFVGTARYPLRLC